MENSVVENQGPSRRRPARPKRRP